MKRLRVFLAVYAAFLAAACYPVTTSNPIGTSAGHSADLALAGLWRAEMAHSEDETVYFHILPMKNGGFTVVIVSGSDKLDGEWSVAHATATEAGEHHFLNAELVFSDGKREANSSRGTVPLLYRVEKDGRVSLFMMAEDAAKGAIRNGLIAGTVEPGNLGDVSITAKAEALEKFFSSDEGAALFTEKFATLTRVSQ